MAGPRLGSAIAHLMAMSVGDRWYYEVPLDGYKQAQGAIGSYLAPKRRPEVMCDWKFSTQLFTAVSNSKAGDNRYIICVERTA